MTLVLLIAAVVASCTAAVPSTASTSRPPVAGQSPLIPDATQFDYPVGFGDCAAAHALSNYKVSYDMTDMTPGDPYKVHTGEDWNGNRGGNTDLGDPVCAVSDGLIVESASFRGWSNIVLIKHRLPDGTFRWSQYAHLQERKVVRGAPVRRGEIIGTIGQQYPTQSCITTGKYAGQNCAHLHFEIRQQEVCANNWPMNVDVIRQQYLDPTDIARDWNPEQGFIESHRVLSGPTPGWAATFPLMPPSCRPAEQDPAVSHAPRPVPANVMDDDFNDNSLDLAQWTTFYDPSPSAAGTITETNSRLEMGANPGDVHVALISRCTLSGDFDVQVDFSLIRWPPNNRKSVSLAAIDLNSPTLGPRIARQNDGDSSEAYQVLSPQTLVGSAPASGLSGRLRLTRVGTSLSGYYHDGAQFRLVGSTTGPTVPTRIGLVGFVARTNSAAAMFAFDNFVVSAGIVTCP